MRKPPPPAPKGTRPPAAGRGRKPGSLNKTTRDVRAFAQKFGPDAILGLAVLARLAKPRRGLDVKPSDNDQVQRMAMSDLLDRAYGKPSQPMEHTIDESWEAMLDRLGR